VKSRERKDRVIYDTVKIVAKRAGVRAHVHALRAAFAVKFDDQHPDAGHTLQLLLQHERWETTLVYLRRKDKARAMETVRDLGWARNTPTVFRPNLEEAHTGFEPVLPA
jgi:site-specific recombinase XerD